jgi:hypothetical protein
MILIFSAFGATANYPDQEMMKKTLYAFINSVGKQTDRDFKLFLIGHDKPEFAPNDFMIWHSLSCDQNNERTLMPKSLPKTVNDAIEYEPVSLACKLGDMSNKVKQGILQTGLWAGKNGLKEFWMMRMDSDDLLAKDTVERIYVLDRMGIVAVFNRTCHMFDVQTKQIAVHSYPYSTTPNALKFKINDDGTLTPDWFYLCLDHTLFHNRVRKDGFKYAELSYTYCIVTNTGNSISGRQTLSKVEHNKEIPLTDDLIERYGIGELL